MLVTLIGIVTVALFAALGYRRGVLSIVAVLFSLLVAGVLAEPLAGIMRPLVEEMPWIPLTLKSLAALLIAGLILLVFLLVLTSWWLRRREKSRLAANLPVLPQWERIGGILTGALWGLGLFLLVLTGLHLLGTVEESLARAQSSRSTPELAKAPEGNYHIAKEQIDASAFAHLVQPAVPIENALTTTLADLTKVAGNPVLLESFQRHPVIARFIRDPRLRALAQDGEIGRLVQARQYYVLLDNAKIAAVLQDKAPFAELRQVEIRKILREVIDTYKP